MTDVKRGFIGTGEVENRDQAPDKTEGAKDMILVDDVDNREFLCELVESMCEELPERKKTKGS